MFTLDIMFIFKSVVDKSTFEEISCLFSFIIRLRVFSCLKTSRDFSDRNFVKCKVLTTVIARNIVFNYLSAQTIF